MNRVELACHVVLEAVGVELFSGEDASPKLLTGLSVENIVADFTQRTYDMTVELAIGGLFVSDAIQQYGKQFSHLAKSSSDGDSSGAANLLRVSYVATKEESPEYAKVDSEVSVYFSRFDLILNRESVAHLLKFVFAMLAPEPGAAKPAIEAPPAASAASATASPAAPRAPPSSDPSRVSMRVHAQIRHLGVVLNKHGSCVGLFAIEGLLADVTMRSYGMHVEASINNINLVDSTCHAGAYSTVLSFAGSGREGNQALVAKYSTFSRDEPSTFPGYETDVYVRMASLRFVFLYRFVDELLRFFVAGPIMPALSGESGDGASSAPLAC